MVAAEPDAAGLAMIAGQQRHWDETLRSNPQMYGQEPSEPGRYAIQRCVAEGCARVLELGAGQGRDTLGLLGAGLAVTALDFSPSGLNTIQHLATDAGLDAHLTILRHDVRQALPFEEASFDACYSHMLLTMALTSAELGALAREIHRVLRPGGLCIYTVRHVGDAHYGAGHDLGDNLYEHGGFVVHFFDRRLVDQLAEGYTLEDIAAFEEGSLPRRLWRITMRRS